MTFISQTRPRMPSRRPLLSRLATLHGLWRQRQALKSLDSGALRDIGLTRQQALGEARRGFWDAPQGWRR